MPKTTYMTKWAKEHPKNFGTRTYFCNCWRGKFQCKCKIIHSSTKFLGSQKLNIKSDIRIGTHLGFGIGLLKATNNSKTGGILVSTLQNLVQIPLSVFKINCTFCHAMPCISVAYAIMQCLFVCLSRLWYRKVFYLCLWAFF